MFIYVTEVIPLMFFFLLRIIKVLELRNFRYYLPPHTSNKSVYSTHSKFLVKQFETTDDFTRIRFHLVLSSAVLDVLENP